MTGPQHAPFDILAIFDHLPNGVLVMSKGVEGLVLVGVNRAALELSKGQLAGFVGEPVRSLESIFPRLIEDLEACMAGREALTREEDCRLPGRRTPRRLIMTYGFVPPGSVILHIEDVTARRQAESQLMQAQKLEAVGQLAGGIAHDFNNLMSIIISYTEFAIDALRHTSPIRDDLMEIRRAGRRAAELTRQLLAFSRKQVLDPDVIDLNKVVNGVERMLRRLLGEDIEIVFQPETSLDCVLADPGQMAQVLMNLAINARDAMPQGGRLFIETSNVLLDGSYADQHEVVDPGRYVLLSVSDTGSGMERAIRERIFEPFFTTKEMGKGTGLGLSTVYGIVKQSGGNIWAYSEPDRGTTFKIYLPRASGPMDRASQPPPLDGSVSGTETVLLVEDEEAVRNLAERILFRAGYLVLTAADGNEALALSDGLSGEIHLLLTDVVMPKMGGKDLADRLVARRPALKVLYMSGYSGEMIANFGVMETDRRFIGKPFSGPDLLRMIRETLDGKTHSHPGVPTSSPGHASEKEGCGEVDA